MGRKKLKKERGQKLASLLERYPAATDLGNATGKLKAARRAALVRWN